MMEIAQILVLAFFFITGFVAIFFTSIGTLLILIGAVVYAFMTKFEMVTPAGLGLLLGLYILGEIVEFFLGFWGARRFGASSRAAWAGMAGGMIGALAGSVFFGVGAFIGTLIGIFAGILAVEVPRHKDWRKAVTAGTGGMLGRVGAIGVKILIALFMGAVILSALIRNGALSF